MKKLKKIQVIGILLVIVGVFIAGVLVYQTFISKKNKVNSQLTNTKETERSSQTANRNESDEVVDSDFILNKDFEIIGLTKQASELIDNNIEGMSIAIQEYLYSLGYYDYRQAIFLGYVEIDYTTNEVKLSFKTSMQQDVSYDVIYNTVSKEWNVQLW